LPNGRIRFRTLSIGLVLIIINIYWVIQKEAYPGWVTAAVGPPDTLSLFYNVIFILFVLLLLNFSLGKAFPKVHLSKIELVAIYAMLCISTSISGIDMVQILPPIMTHGFWYATPENEWANLFWNYLPEWLTVSDKPALTAYYEGDASFYSHIQPWIVPILFWTIFVFILIAVMLCLNVIIRKQWTVKEKLTYPIIQLPLEMIVRQKSFFTNRLLITGFAIAAAIDLVNSLNMLYPKIPAIPVRSLEIGHYFTERPLNAIGWTPVCFFPFAIGMTFCMPLDLSFSCWFFYLFLKAQLILRSILGFRGLSGFLYLKTQESGAYIGFGILAIWLLRRHFAQILKRLTSKDDPLLKDEVRIYRIAIAGAMLGMGILLSFGYIAGIPLWAGAIFFTLYFLIAIAITRMRAELGPPTNELYYGGPMQVMTLSMGTRRFSKPALATFSLFWFFTRAYRGHPMANQLESFKMAEQVQKDNRKLPLAILLAVIISIPVTFWATLDVGYREVGVPGNWASNEAFRRLDNWLQQPTEMNTDAVLLMGLGAFIILGFSIMRLRFVWCPIHPVAYLMANSWTMSWIWFSIFVGWAIKWVILKYSGLRLYRKAFPFFLGLILGEFVIGAVLNILRQTLHIPTYVFWH
jgi:hypothetical protein